MSVFVNIIAICSHKNIVQEHASVTRSKNIVIAPSVTILYDHKFCSERNVSKHAQSPKYQTTFHDPNTEASSIP